MLKPLLKINTVVIAENCIEQTSKETVELFVASLIERIDGTLRDMAQPEVIINLDVLGKITKLKN